MNEEITRLYNAVIITAKAEFLLRSNPILYPDFWHPSDNPLQSPEYLKWRKDWKQAEREYELARERMNNAIRDFCPVAKLDDRWMPAGEALIEL